jgi:PST family polysaccharide transporter
MLDTYRRTLGAITLVLMPLCFTLAAVADPLVHAVLGQQWVPAIPVVALIALVGGLQAVATTTGSLYLAKGRADLSLRWSMGSSAFLMVCYAIGTRWGVTGVAAGFLTGIVVLLYPAFRIPLGLIGARPSDLAGTVLPAAACAVAGAGAAYGTVRAFASAGQSSWVQLTAGLLVSLAVTINLLLLVRPEALHDLLRLTLAQRRSRSGGSAGSDVAGGDGGDDDGGGR